MKEVLSPILNDLEAFATVGDEWVSSTDSFPYITYEYAQDRTEQRHNTELTLDLWTEGEDSDVIEDISAKVKEALDRKKYHGGKSITWVYFNTRRKVREETPKVKRVRMIFDIYNYYI